MTEIKKGLCFYKIKDKRKYHVVEIIKEPETQVVVKYFGINKKWWHYEIESLYGMELSFETGLYFLKRGKR